MEECCDICGSVGVPDALVTCSQCKASLQHMYCMRARFLEYPDDWCCEECEPTSKPTFSQLANCEPSSKPTFSQLANCSEMLKGAARPSKIRKLLNESKRGPFNWAKKVATRKTEYISINDVIKLPSGAIEFSSRSKVTCQSSTSQTPTREEKSRLSRKNSAFDVRWTSSPVHSRSTPRVSPTQEVQRPIKSSQPSQAPAKKHIKKEQPAEPILPQRKIGSWSSGFHSTFTIPPVRMDAHGDGLPRPDDQIELTVRNNIFYPDHNKVSRFISSRFALQTCDSGSSWKYVTHDQRQWYWDEFAKKYKWDEAIDGTVRDLWFRSCGTLYRRTIHGWRTRGRHPQTVTTERWTAWTAAWQEEGWVARAAKNKKNRNSEPAGPGTGTTKHIAGAKTYSAHGQDLRSRHGRDPTSWELYVHTHRHDDGSFVDERSRRVNEAMERYMAESMNPSDEGTSPVVPSPESVNSMFKSVVGGKKKGHMYGCGSMATTIYPDDMAANRRGGSSGVSKLSQETSSLRDRLDVSMRSNDKLRSDVQATQQENTMLRTRMASLEEQVRLLVTGMSQGAPVQSHGQTSIHTLYGRGASSKERSTPVPSHGSTSSAGTSSHRKSSQRHRYSHQCIGPSQNYGFDDDDSDGEKDAERDDDNNAYDDDEIQTS